jgi:hypothetical protein
MQPILELAKEILLFIEHCFLDEEVSTARQDKVPSVGEHFTHIVRHVLHAQTIQSLFRGIAEPGNLALVKPSLINILYNDRVDGADFDVKLSVVDPV